MIPERQTEVCKRFYLTDGQFFAQYVHKNLQWFLNGEQFGYGDLTERDVKVIGWSLESNETFEGFNEHHGGDFQQMAEPIIKITMSGVSYPYKERIEKGVRLQG